MIRLFVTIAAACIALPAFAQVPGYDTARHCAESAKGNRTAENECRRNEADARRELERSRVSKEILASCNEKMRAEQSYLLLYGCVLDQAEVKTKRPAAPIVVGPINAPVANAPAVNTGTRSRAAALVGPDGLITVIRGLETTIEKPPGR
jgi:hypothetical protein